MSAPTGTARAPRPGLADRAAAKLTEVEDRIADLEVIRDTLRAALAAGCDDLASCSETEACPLPFADLALAVP